MFRDCNYHTIERLLTQLSLLCAAESSAALGIFRNVDSVDPQSKPSDSAGRDKQKLQRSEQSVVIMMRPEDIHCARSPLTEIYGDLVRLCNKFCAIASSSVR